MKNWPQYVYLTMTVLSALVWVAKDGEPRGNYDAGIGVAGAMFGVWLLWMGGFFDPLGW